MIDSGTSKSSSLMYCALFSYCCAAQAFLEPVAMEWRKHLLFFDVAKLPVILCSSVGCHLLNKPLRRCRLFQRIVALHKALYKKDHFYCYAKGGASF